MNNRWTYWKRQEKDRKWNPIPDTAQARKIAIGQGAMFFTCASLSAPYSGNGEPEPIRFGDMPLDFDAVDIGEALKDLRELCLIHLPELFGADPYEIQFFLSGGKGFHAMLPAKWFGAQAGDVRLPLLYKGIATEWKEQFTLTTLDLSLYCMGKGKMFRAPNVRRQNGMYKVPLSLEEVRDFSADELMELGKAPRKIELIGDN